MKKIVYIIAVIFAVSFYSCEKVSDNEIILYDGQNRINFVDDSVRVNLADLPIKEVYTIKLPIEVMGFIDYNKSRPFEIEVVSGVSQNIYTEAVSGKQYKTLPANYEIMKDSVKGYVKVDFNRAEIDDKKIYELRFKIKANNVFGVGAKEKLYAKMIVLNFLEKPDWWDVCGVTSDFNTLMLSKLYEVYGKSPITSDMVWKDYMGMMAALKAVSDWLDANPQYGVSFNEKDKEYFQMFA